MQGGTGPTGSVGPSSLPTGAIVQFGGNFAPTGFLVCDGTVYQNTSYPALSSVIGTAYGGTLGSTFKVPDFQSSRNTYLIKT